MGSVVECSSFAVDFCSLSLILFYLGHCSKAEVISASKEVQFGSSVFDPICLST